jgi:hypothetical protein
MDTLEKFYIFHGTKLDNQINDKLAVRPNIIFELIVQKDPPRGIPNICHTDMNSHLKRTRALSVNAQTATIPTGVNYIQPPYATVHHDTSFHIVKLQSKDPIKSAITSKELQ